MEVWAIGDSVFYFGGTHGKHGFDPYPSALTELDRVFERS